MPHRDGLPVPPPAPDGDETRTEPPFEVVPPSGARTGIIVHVPHAATRIPADVRAEIILDDDELARELDRLTDWHTDDLFAWLTGDGATLFVNRLSRLVFDPERFLDDAEEPTAARGQGVIYSHGSRGQPIRELTEDLRARRIEQLYRPYHEAFDRLVEETLEAFGSCLIVDAHSFPSLPLASELDQAPDRPDICIGTDAMHTPEDLALGLEQGFMAEGLRVRYDAPFAGTFVPSGWYRRDTRVTSVMIEVRRGLYLDEAGARRRSDYDGARAAIQRALTAAIRVS